MLGSSASVQIVLAAMQKLHWISADFDLASVPIDPCRNDKCWIEWMTLAISQHSDSILGSAACNRLQELQRDGWVLWDRWPRESFSSVEAWLEPRLYLISPSVRRLLSEKVHTIVCSQLGRDYRNMPCWPTLLDWAIRSSQRDSASLIVAEGTTLDEPTRQFARAATVPLIELILEKPFRFSKDLARQSLAASGDSPKQSAGSFSDNNNNNAAVEWLANSLSQLVASNASAANSEQSIWISPLICENSQSENCDERAVDELKSLLGTPLRDRACLALADRVSTISIKPSGTIAKLLQSRLSDPAFPTGSCFLAIPNYRYARNQDWKSHQAWLDRGAVGYVVDVEAGVGLNNQLSRCNSVSAKSTLQPCLSLSKWIQGQMGPWTYLTHCTRGNSVAWPQESMEGYVRRVWNDGNAVSPDPFLTLMNILQERCLRGSNWMTRTQTPMVSLSAASIEDLLARRTFRTHLGRWDWEPYGIIFCRSCLADAHAVTYGPKTDFEQLPGEMQLFYQPNDGRQDWSVEREYRFVGNIDLATIPSHSAAVFTQTENEARQAAAISPFPVIWVRGTENGN